MLQVARLAPKMLGDSAGLVRGLFARQLSDEGTGRDRDRHPDLYHTIFALADLHALTSDLSTLSSQHSTSATWLRGFGGSSALYFVHLGALARCWSAVGLKKMPAGLAAAVLARIETFRARDGGYDSC